MIERDHQGPGAMRRRAFLRKSCRAAPGLCLLPLAACSRPDDAPGTRDSGLPGSLESELERQIPALLAQAGVPGLSMAIIRCATLAWRRGFGLRDAVSKEPVDADTVFEVGSVSKTVFAYAVMKLWEKGVLDLDTPLTRYTPERFPQGDPRLDLITARHVLSHRSGFHNWRSADDPLRIHFTPGTQYSYSGEGYAYLQAVVTHLTGHVNPRVCSPYEAGLKVCATDFDAYMKENLLVPFGMGSSGYLWNEAIASHAARPHDDNGTPLTRHATATDAARYGAAGGLLTTPTDYAKFLIGLIAPQRSDAFLLTQASVTEMLRPQVTFRNRTEGADAWALGWGIQHKANGDFIRHGGSNPGFQALVAATVRSKSGFIIATNSDNGYEVIKRLVASEAMQQFIQVTA